jgi:hypothetical protein
MRFIPPQYGSRNREREVVYGLIKPTIVHVLLLRKTRAIPKFALCKRRSVLRTQFYRAGSSQEAAAWRE